MLKPDKMFVVKVLNQQSHLVKNRKFEFLLVVKFFSNKALLVFGWTLFDTTEGVL
jgi:hypothetical protein